MFRGGRGGFQIPGGISGRRLTLFMGGKASMKFMKNAVLPVQV